MNREKGMAYCGLVCAACGQNDSCAGCRDEGCRDREWCKNRRCCVGKGLSGCWECRDFPCDSPMLQKLRVRAFAAFAGEYGEERLIDCLEAGERAGFRYHYPDELVGDYDTPSDEAGIWRLLLESKSPE